MLSKELAWTSKFSDSCLCVSNCTTKNSYFCKSPSVIVSCWEHLGLKPQLKLHFFFYASSTQNSLEIFPLFSSQKNPTLRPDGEIRPDKVQISYHSWKWGSQENLVLSMRTVSIYPFEHWWSIYSSDYFLIWIRKYS